jgi:Recombinase
VSFLLKLIDSGVEVLFADLPELNGAQGLSLARIAAELNKRKVPTPRGGRWDHWSVGNVLQRLAA